MSHPETCFRLAWCAVLKNVHFWNMFQIGTVQTSLYQSRMWNERSWSWRIKDEIFCFAHLWWCQNGWASNILSGRCWRSRYPPRLKYWMPIHYDTIEDGQNKKSHLLFSFLVRIVLFFAFYRRDLFVKNIITSFHWFHLNNYTPYENKCFNPRNQIHRVEFVTRVNSVCVQMRHAIRGVHTR